MYRIHWCSFPVGRSLNAEIDVLVVELLERDLDLLAVVGAVEEQRTDLELLEYVKAVAGLTQGMEVGTLVDLGQKADIVGPCHLEVGHLEGKTVGDHSL